MDRRVFGRLGSGAIATLILGDHKLLAQSSKFVGCIQGLPCNGTSNLNSSVVNFHNSNIAPAYAESLVGLPSASALQSAAINHLDQWNYYVAQGASGSFQSSLIPSNYVLNSAVVQSVAGNFNSYGVKASTATVQNLLTVPSASVTTATSYANSVGLSSVMNSVYSSLSAFASGSEQVSDCETYDILTNTLALLAVIWGASSVVLGPVGALAGAGFGLTAALLRFERPTLSC